MPGVEAFLDEYIPAGGGVALDVGANHGEWSRFLAERFAAVYAIEPTPALEAGLIGLHPRVRLLPVGAWSRAERRAFVRFAHDANTSTAEAWEGIMAGEPVGGFEAECMAIDEMPIDGRVDFMKIDVESAEVEVLLGAEQTLLHDRPQMIIEVHTAANGKAISGLLGALGYQVTLVRHPYYQEGSEWWDKHYWLVGEPG